MVSSENKAEKHKGQQSVWRAVSFLLAAVSNGKGRRTMDYSGTKWKKKRRKILRMDGYQCRVARMYGRTEEANTVHHIYPADQYPEYAWCDWNLISVSQAGHNKLENRLTGELTALGKQLMEQTRPGVDWRRERKINLGN